MRVDFKAASLGAKTVHSFWMKGSKFKMIIMTSIALSSVSRRLEDFTVLFRPL